ncbi:NAD-binding protein [Pseudomonas thivervalensis]|uniref:NAD-binding protein n=1 Tax=Pseudomonas thivervalensis TaxID=86265 RepID=UPI0009E98E41|nr:NAD-binding protein [Pseudomonas thivervalensis]
MCWRLGSTFPSSSLIPGGADASDFSFKVYYGEGTRVDVLHAAGAHHARAILVCVDDARAATRIVEQANAALLHARCLHALTTANTPSN